MNERLGSGPELLPASEELLAEFARVRNNFLEAFKDVSLPYPTDVADRYFAEHGLTIASTVTIPYTAEAYKVASDIAHDTAYSFPVVTDLLKPQRLHEDIVGEGFGFFVPSYGLSFITDTSEAYTELCDDEIAERFASGLYVHEQMHSAVHHIPQIVAQTDALGVPEKLGHISPLSGVFSLEYDASTTDVPYVPKWIDEAIACYVEGQISQMKYPSNETSGTFTHIPEWGGNMFHLDEHYVVRSPEYPDQPGVIAGAVAGQGLENIETRLPGTIENIFSIARGELDGEEFRAEIRKKVVPKLFELMFTKQPYTTWTDICNLTLEDESYR